MDLNVHFSQKKFQLGNHFEGQVRLASRLTWLYPNLYLLLAWPSLTPNFLISKLVADVLE